MPMTYRESMESMGTFLSVASSEKIPDRAVQAVRQVFSKDRDSVQPVSSFQ